MSWGYTNENGPPTWQKSYKYAGGEEQSPIDIKQDAATFDPTLCNNPLVVKYQSEKELEMTNVGSSVKINIKQHSTIKHGPLESEYRLAQFHYHWGSDSKKGSEHTVDGKTYSAELHLVHWNENKYSSFEEAVDKHDGLAVLGILIKVGKEHDGFKIITDNLNKIKFKGKLIHLKGDYNPQCLLPKNLSEYWTYHGSLTTPPCYESITWIVFHEIVEVSEDQVKALRGMCCDECDGEHIVNNFRPPLPVGTRRIRSSFE
ncbi:carbonic anhydrase 1-like isoform X2 [Gigantopelta aegis]|uniref:carbonic anhydrase 1-like isoform X2 n=1 Tax=Gigantopelta aegis TaxID=1735272 RepID=UPI001B887CE9|nr:carbonic anhydrase 1-like isoform X2 [Gigantopelta aegis]